MASRPVPEGYARCAVTYSNPSSGASRPTNVFMVESGVQDAVEVAIGITSAYVSSFDESFAPEYFPITLHVVTSTSEDTRNVAISPSTASSVALPSTSVLVRKRTGIPGRKNRGRMYVPALLTDVQVGDDGAIPEPELNGLSVAYGIFLDALTTEASPMVLEHNDGSTPTVVTRLEVDSKVATQRRRLRK